jgi:hypothetical protein
MWYKSILMAEGGGYMEITIDLRAGASHSEKVTKSQIDKNIKALEKAILRKPLSISDTIKLVDTLSILEGIREQLPGVNFCYDGSSPFFYEGI